MTLYLFCCNITKSMNGSDLCRYSDINIGHPTVPVAGQYKTIGIHKEQSTLKMNRK